jgi:transaldolase
VQEVAEFDEAAFTKMHEGDQMAVDKLKEGIEGFKDAQVELESILQQMAKDRDLGDPTDSE